ncbi:MAG: hypothetical protein JWR63_4073 [Conexibacter sp.]|nr:hypothetical protein [Conexibacter sp.]
MYVPSARNVLGGALATVMILVAPAPSMGSWTTNGNSSGGLASNVRFISRFAHAPLFVVYPVGGPGQQATVCNYSEITGHLNGPSLGSGVGLMSGLTPSFTSSCTSVGQSSAVKCASSGSFNGATYAPSTNITSGSYTGFSCVIVKLNGACGNATTFNPTGSTTGSGITITGSMPATYGNTSQLLIFPSSGQALNASWSSSGCLQGTGTGSASAIFRASLGGPLLDDMGYYVQSGYIQPQITN